MVKWYILKERINFDDEIDVHDVTEVIEITKAEAVLDYVDGWCRCFKCDRSFDMFNEKEAEDFFSTHEHLFNINDFEIYKCEKDF